ncbi:MAG: ectonucleotide pyrophosphatase/phosphodiesterase [bacterium]|nr:ectonucleotide pyrophosphatase/phosphodiesterase [bacterium]
MRRIIVLLASFFIIPFGLLIIQLFPTPTAIQSVEKTIPPKQRVILISMDGARADYVRDFNLPNIHAIARKGAFTYQAQTILPSRTLPGHASMLSGYSVAKHGISSNEWKKGLHLKTDTVFDHLIRAGKTAKLMAAKEKFETFRKPGIQFSVEIIDDISRSMVDEVLKTLSTENYDFLFVHFKAPDRAGHDFGAQSQNYKKALTDIDTSIGKIIDHLKKLKLLETTTIILTSDHGMKGNDHGGKTPEEMTIPWIIMGPNIKNDYHIKSEVSIMDSTATVLSQFGIPLPSDMDGKIPLEIISK